jgi:hypothetical protein
MESPDWPDPDPDHVLTARQQRILQVIRHFGQRRGYSPTVREIGEAADLASPSSVSHHLSVLQRKGYLRRIAGRGDSMINAAIADGDIVVVRQQSHAENGDIVAAMIDGETTIKTLQLVRRHDPRQGCGCIAPRLTGHQARGDPEAGACQPHCHLARVHGSVCISLATF